MDTAYQQPTDLLLGITQAAPHPMTILEQATWRVGGCQLQFHIIGESHAVRVETAGKLLFYEILACLPLRAETCTHLHPFTALTDHRFHMDNYAVEVSFTTSRPASPLRGKSLEVKFPRVHGITPITRIEWQRRRDSITWWTLHTYPNPLRTLYVYSYSQLQCP